MDGNEQGGTYVDMENDAAGKAFGSPPVSAQKESMTGSGSYKTSIAMNDDFFLQEGFTYTGLLLGDITHPAVYEKQDEQDNIKDSSATMLGDEEDNPWDVSMFNDIQLDEVYDAGTIDNQ
ncbi:uncharacterized protein [Lolium perenne]|uniref:uncharacterized protein n=1 Tax=Lolium perenne TaxID=4522 RepID=UPI0021E9F616|nr:uncharacterized protein LOC127319691 [Lolium perenne]